jgi:hypothetical protein
VIYVSLSINDLRAYLEANTGEKFYPLTFSVNAPNDCSVVLFNGGQPRRGLSKVHIQVINRATHPATAEAKALQIRDFLHNKTNFDVGTTHVVFCTALNPFPLFIGQDENGRYKYSLNYEMLMEV